jgi:hypothetical protein
MAHLESPAWLTDQFYAEQIQPRLGEVEVKTIAAALERLDHIR